MQLLEHFKTRGYFSRRERKHRRLVTRHALIRTNQGRVIFNAVYGWLVNNSSFTTLASKKISQLLLSQNIPYGKRANMNITRRSLNKMEWLQEHISYHEVEIRGNVFA